MEYAKGNVKLELWRIKLLGKLFMLIKRRTYTPSGKDWITDYGVEIIGFSFWVHVPLKCLT